VINFSPSVPPLRHSVCKYSGTPPAFEGARFLVSCILHLWHSNLSTQRHFRNLCRLPRAYRTRLRWLPSAFSRRQTAFPSIVHSNYGNQPFRPLALEGSSSSDDGEISNIDDEIDLPPSTEEIPARAKSRQPHASLPKCMIDLTGKGDDDTAISLRRKRVHSSVP
jgi:hypothetical protein